MERLGNELAECGGLSEVCASLPQAPNDRVREMDIGSREEMEETGYKIRQHQLNSPSLHLAST